MEKWKGRLVEVTRNENSLDDAGTYASGHGMPVQIKLLDLQERRYEVNGAVRQAEARIEVAQIARFH